VVMMVLISIFFMTFSLCWVLVFHFKFDHSVGKNIDIDGTKQINNGETR
jgi:hypothetical protein